MDQGALPHEEYITRIGELPGALLHESRRGMRRDARDVDAPRGEFHHHEHVVGYQAVPWRDLDREKVRGSEDAPVQFEELGPLIPP